jgi:hypothetical protein
MRSIGLSAYARLRERWTQGRLSAIASDLAAGRDWTRHLLLAPDGTSSVLPDLATCGRPVLPGEAAPRDLRGAVLQDLDLTESAALADCALDGAVLDNVQLYDASLTGSSLCSAAFVNGSSLVGAVLRHCNLRDARLSSVSLARADLRNSDIRGADLRHADLRDARLADVTTGEEPIYGFLVPQRWSRWTKFGGKYQTQNHLSYDMDPSLRRRIAAEAEFLLFRKSHPLLGSAWYAIANGGRSASRLGGWALFVWLFFGVLYSPPTLPHAFAGSVVGDALVKIGPRFVQSNVITSLTRGDGLYFSAVTLTTLGYGDIVPASCSASAKCLVICEAGIGFVLLGMFVALLLQAAVAPSQ